MGLVKPNPVIYQQVLQDQQLNANEVLFFDDNVANIEQAINVGIDSHLVDPNIDFTQIQQILDSYVS
jgi:putative hydrolase of the HAD superfamily